MTVAARIQSPQNYYAADLGLEGSLLAGILGGYVTGLLSGFYRHFRPYSKGEALTCRCWRGWCIGRLLARPGARSGRDLALFAVPGSQHFPLLQGDAELSRHRLHLPFRRGDSGGRVSAQRAERFAFRAPAVRPVEQVEGPHTLVHRGLYATTIFAVTIPLKIWNNARNEKKLEEQERLLVEARLAALTSQINPHFCSTR